MYIFKRNKLGAKRRRVAISEGIANLKSKLKGLGKVVEKAELN